MSAAHIALRWALTPSPGLGAEGDQCPARHPSPAPPRTVSPADADALLGGAHGAAGPAGHLGLHADAVLSVPDEVGDVELRAGLQQFVLQRESGLVPGSSRGTAGAGALLPPPPSPGQGPLAKLLIAARPQTPMRTRGPTTVKHSEVKHISTRLHTSMVKRSCNFWLNIGIYGGLYFTK